jgi:hypothetical protein
VGHWAKKRVSERIKQYCTGVCLPQKHFKFADIHDKRYYGDLKVISMPHYITYMLLRIAVM